VIIYDQDPFPQQALTGKEADARESLKPDRNGEGVHPAPPAPAHPTVGAGKNGS